MKSATRSLIASLHPERSEEISIRGWILRLRELAQTTFIIVKDCSGEVQCVADSDSVRTLALKRDEPVEIRGKVKPDTRARAGFEIEVQEISVLNPVTHLLPFNSSSDISDIGLETLLSHRPLEGIEITTGGQRLHKRSHLEAALNSRGIDTASFESHLQMFEMGMPPHGGLAIGLEQVTAHILHLANVRQATLYSRDTTRISS